MSYVEDFKHDIFVSYAHVDNLPAAGVADGWVTTVIRELERQVKQLVGDKRLDLWRDPQLDPNVHVSDKLDQTVAQSAVFVIVLSEGYLNSPWCAAELETFVRRRGNDPATLFVIEKDRVERERWPQALRDLRAREFWYEEADSKQVRTYGDPVPNPLTDRRYYHLVNDLGVSIEERLRAMRTEVTVPLGETSGVRVFLAEVTDDLLDQRDRVRNHLEQQGMQVLPERHYFDPDEMTEHMRLDMARCSLFVQLLSPVGGRPLNAQGIRLPSLQHSLATDGSLDIMQWYMPGLDVDAIADTDQRQLLEGEFVYAEPLELFSQRVAKAALAPPPEVQPASDALLFVNHAPNDQDVAEQVGTLLANLGVGYAMPLNEGSPSERREDLENHLAECDGVLLVYGNSPVTWVRNQMLASRKSLARRDKPPARALCDCPPPDKADTGMRLPGWQVLDFRGGLQAIGLRDFVASVASGASA